MCVCNVHTVMASGEDPELRAALLASSFNVPDGQPLVWAINSLGHSLAARVYGPELMARACAQAAVAAIASTSTAGRNQGALVQLALNLRQRYPGVKIVGGYSPPHRPLTTEEEDAVVEEINRSRADVVWVGIGVPKQEKWMARCARSSRRRCLSASARRSTSTPGSSPRRRTGSRRPASNGPTGSPTSRVGCGGATFATTRAS